ncbi:MAG TPA: carboxypeptidase-like regulatory domain-containing protein [Thermoanaerobaculia bacterium]|nr:carboxypeptidase-like regulatory domain-containing protein [Thermoanaerobaculia bacterium]
MLGETSPLPSAGVYAYQLADASLRKVLTDPQGNFLFQDLPAGLYKIIAHKIGFTPVVVRITRTTAQTYQFVELQLAEERRNGSGRVHPDDFWSVRSSIPGDVLRQIQSDERERTQLSLADAQRLDLSNIAKNAAKAGFSTSMQAMTGVDQITQANGLLSGGGVGIAGQLGQVQVGLRGSFWQLNGDASGRPGMSGNTGQASNLSLDLARGTGSRIVFTSQSNRLTRASDGAAPIDFENYQVNWTQGLGETGRSDFSAQYTAESNYHAQAAIEPREIPEASRTWRLEGAYTTELSDGNTLQTGMRYRELQFDTPTPGQPASDLLSTANIDLFSRGGMRVQPAVLLEYGLYSTLSDGSLSLMPQGGVVLQLGTNWQLEGSASQRVYQNVTPNPTFMPALFASSDLCEQGSESCYRVSLGRKPAKDDSDGSVALTATRRKIGDTLRFYFSEETFDRLESLYLVRGDELPELRLQLSKHLTPRVVTTFDSSIGKGGGGIFLAANQRPYENQVQYLVASLDTQFLTSSTGVFLAFHRLSQELQPLGVSAGSGAAAPQMEIERLRLMLTQDLKFLFDLASDWAVQLDMEVSRGPLATATSTTTTNNSDLHRRLMGGIAVRF